MEDAQTGGYEHFMLKEIHEQPRAVSELIHLLDDLPHTLSMVERMSAARHLYLVGSGSSYHACVSRRLLPGLPGRPPGHPSLGSAIHRPIYPRLET